MYDYKRAKLTCVLTLHTIWKLQSTKAAVVTFGLTEVH